MSWSIPSYLSYFSAALSTPQEDGISCLISCVRVTVTVRDASKSGGEERVHLSAAPEPGGDNVAQETETRRERAGRRTRDGECEEISFLFLGGGDGGLTTPQALLLL